VSDSAYIDAVRRGDMKTAQRMVDEAAKAAGYNLGPLWHGSHKDFNRFMPGRAGAFYFTSNKDYAQSYGPNLRSFYIKATKVADLVSPKSPQYKELIKAFNDAGGWAADPDIFDEMGRKSPKFDPKKDLTWEIFDYPASDAGAGLIDKGFKVFRLQERRDFDSYAVMDPKLVKLADPVTCDDAGNVIPLSQRFQDTSKDIRNPRTVPRQFPYEYAAYLKANFPEIWKAGGNIRGNDTFRWWTAYRKGDRSPTVMHWWNVTRPAWIARHYRDHRLPGVVAQIKWGTVGVLGVAGMKRVVEDAIRKRYA
jgi:hypothetical protein